MFSQSTFKGLIAYLFVGASILAENTATAQSYISLTNATNCAYTMNIYYHTTCVANGKGFASVAIPASGSATYTAPAGRIITSVAIVAGGTTYSTWTCSTGQWSPINPIGCPNYILWVHGLLNNCRIDYT